MSDALTDIRRDERRGELEEKALQIELNKVLSETATKADIEILLQIWEEWSKIPRGYWGVSNQAHYKQRKALYEKLLHEGEITIRLK